MDKFDLLKSHVEAFTRKDGSVVRAHDRQAYEKLASQARNTAEKAARYSHNTWPDERHNKSPSTSHEDAAELNKQAGYAHFAAAKLANDFGMKREADMHLGLANHHAGMAASHSNSHKTSPNGVPSELT